MSTTSRLLWIMIALSLLLFGSCSKDDDEIDETAAQAQTDRQLAEEPDSLEPEREQREVEYEPVTEEWDLAGTPLTVGGLIYKPASQWTDHGTKDDKVAFYTYGPLKEENYEAQLSVYFIPQADAAGYMDYFQHWLGMLDLGHLKNPESAAIRHDREADGMTVHVQSLFGPYMDDPDYGQTGEVEPSRLIGIVVEAPEGAVLFELVGPDYTARTMIEAFMNGIYRLKRTP